MADQDSPTKTPTPVSAPAPTPASVDARPKRRYGGLSAQERSEQRKAKLLEAAVDVFGTLGLRRATVRDICNEARITERYFSEHFQSLTDAYEAVFKLLSAQAQTVTSEAMGRAPLGTMTMARAGLTAFLNFIKDDPRRAQILMIDASSYWRHITVRSNPVLGRHAMVMHHFAKMIYPQMPDNIELELVGAALIGATLQASLVWVQGGFQQPVDVVVGHLLFAWDGVDRLLRGEFKPL